MSENDLIRRGDVIGMIDGWINTDKYYHPNAKHDKIPVSEMRLIVEDVKAVERQEQLTNTTIYGYPVEYLVMIANVARDKGITPEDAMTMMMDIKTVVKAVTNEAEKALAKATNRMFSNAPTKLNGTEHGQVFIDDFIGDTNVHP